MTKKDFSFEQERESYEKPVCRVNVFTTDTTNGGLDDESGESRHYDRGRSSEDDGGWL